MKCKLIDKRMALSIAFFGCGFFVLPAYADNVSYALGHNTCHFGLSDQSGGSVHRDDQAGTAGFSRRRLPKGGELSFSFSCTSPVAKDYCRTEWKKQRLDDDESTLKLMKVRSYPDFHPVYESIALAVNSTAVTPPLPRSVRFCIMNDALLLEGIVFVGNEKINETGIALRILKSIEFKPPASNDLTVDSPVPPPRPALNALT